MSVENYICLKISDENVVLLVPGIVRNLFTMLEECPNCESNSIASRPWPVSQ